MNSPALVTVSYIEDSLSMVLTRTLSPSETVMWLMMACRVEIARSLCSAPISWLDYLASSKIAKNSSKSSGGAIPPSIEFNASSNSLVVSYTFFIAPLFLKNLTRSL